MSAGTAVVFTQGLPLQGPQGTAVQPHHMASQVVLLLLTAAAAGPGRVQLAEVEAWLRPAPLLLLPGCVCLLPLALLRGVPSLCSRVFVSLDSSWMPKAGCPAKQRLQRGQCCMQSVASTTDMGGPASDSIVGVAVPAGTCGDRCSSTWINRGECTCAVPPALVHSTQHLCVATTAQHEAAKPSLVAPTRITSQLLSSPVTLNYRIRLPPWCYGACR